MAGVAHVGVLPNVTEGDTAFMFSSTIDIVGHLALAYVLSTQNAANLERIHLNGIDLHDHGCAVLMPALAKLPRLVYLSLSNNFQWNFYSLFS